MKIAVVTDSGCGLTSEQAKAAGLFMLPLQITIDNTTYRDCFDISTLDLYDRLKTGAMPKTSSPIVKDVEELMHHLKKEGYDHILSIPLSSGLSGTHQVISMMANEKEIPITTIEIYTTCNLQRYLALEANRLVALGKDIAEIKDTLEVMIESNTTIILPNDLDHLKRGGRLTPIAASLANLLKIKPVLIINKDTQGKIDVKGKVRTEKKAMNFAIDCIYENVLDKQYNVYVIHSNCLEKAEEIAAQIQSTHKNVNVEIDYISAVIASHTGLDCIAIQIIEKNK